MNNAIIATLLEWNSWFEGVVPEGLLGLSDGKKPYIPKIDEDAKIMATKFRPI